MSKQRLIEALGVKNTEGATFSDNDTCCQLWGKGGCGEWGIETTLRGSQVYKREYHVGSQWTDAVVYVHTHEGMESFYCPDCGTSFISQPEEYLQQHPNAAEMERDQMLNRHLSYECEYSENYDTVVNCDHCGEKIFTGTLEYMNEYPNASSMAIGQAIDNHDKSCLVLAEKDWQEWRETISYPANKEMTPRQAVETYIESSFFGLAMSVQTPPDRGESFWEKEKLMILREFLGSDQVKKIRRRLEDRLRKSSETEILSSAIAVGILLD